MSIGDQGCRTMKMQLSGQSKPASSPFINPIVLMGYQFTPNASFSAMKGKAQKFAG